jgi:hypothetical protein
MIHIDRYTITARVLPALVILVPLALAVLPWIEVTFDPWKWGGAGLVTTVMAYFISQVTRDAGKKLEEKLWHEWGGCPSAIYLRHRDTQLASGEKQALHKAIKRLNPNLDLPTAAEEARDPASCDQRYDRAAAWLRNQTRDSKKFLLIYAENVSYGFQRNLLALRPWGLLSSVIGLFSAGLALWFGKPAFASLAGSLAIGGYLLLITTASLRRQSDVYTRRLFEAVDMMLPIKTSRSKATAKAEA